MEKKKFITYGKLDEIARLIALKENNYQCDCTSINNCECVIDGNTLKCQGISPTTIISEELKPND